jgi:hypothetical protein
VPPSLEDNLYSRMCIYGLLVCHFACRINSFRWVEKSSSTWSVLESYNQNVRNESETSCRRPCGLTVNHEGIIRILGDESRHGPSDVRPFGARWNSVGWHYRMGPSYMFGSHCHNAIKLCCHHHPPPSNIEDEIVLHSKPTNPPQAIATK